QLASHPMEEVDRNVIRQLVSIGCDWDPKVTSIGQLTAEMMVEAVGRCLRLMQPDESFSITLPDGMNIRYRIGQQLAEAVRGLGYRGELGYQSLLYPSERDARSLLVFLVERLPKDEAGELKDALTGASGQQLLDRLIAARCRAQLAAPWLPACCRPDGLALRQGGLCFEGGGGGPCGFRTVYPCVPNRAAPAAAGSEIPPSVRQFQRGLPFFCGPAGRPGCWAASAAPGPSLLSWTASLLLAERREEEAAIGARPSTADTESGGVGVDVELLPRSLRQAVADAVKQAAGGRRPPPPPKPPKPTRKKSANDEHQQLLKSAETEATESAEARAARAREDLERLRAELEAVAKATGKAERRAAKLDAQTAEAQAAADAWEQRERQEAQTRLRAAELLAAGEADRLEEAQAAQEAKLARQSEQWAERRAAMEAERRALQAELDARSSVLAGRLDELRESRADLAACREDLRAREAERELLQRAADRLARHLAEGDPSLTRRRELTRGLLDFAANLKKQRAELGRISDELRAAQKEINRLTGKLDRTYRVADEAVFSGASDPTGKRLYKLLAGLHQHCDAVLRCEEDKSTLQKETIDLEDHILVERRRRMEENADKLAADLAELKRANKALKAAAAAAAASG
ncbi:hypothetical protein BOX15_Mlig011846g1, partial [Macrostomum lignano]